MQSAVVAPASPAALAPAEQQEIDAALQKLSANKAAWAAAPLSERIAVLKEVRGRLLDKVRRFPAFDRTAASAVVVPTSSTLPKCL
jgi:acyl-CoA reductase-like NAD-dependent aldehyde dehydrogenase